MWELMMLTLRKRCRMKTISYRKTTTATNVSQPEADAMFLDKSPTDSTIALPAAL